MKSKAKHKGKGPRIDEQRWDKALEDCAIALQLPSPPAEAVPPLYGLTITSGWWCSRCTTCASTEESMRKHVSEAHAKESADRRTKHLSDAHPKQTVDSQTMTAGAVQRFNNWLQSSWFRINATVSPPPVDDLVLNGQPMENLTDFAHETVDALIAAGNVEPDTMDDVHNTNAWLRACKWHELTQDLDYRNIQSLLAPLDSDYLCPLELAIDQYISAAEMCIRRVHVNYLKTINSEEPPK